MFNSELSYKKILIFWIPLAATWLMMSVEGPFLAGIIARMSEPKFNLAAYGVAYSFALIIEAPVIMMMSASTALVKDNHSFKKLKNFTFTLNITITCIMLILLIPDIFYFITITLINLPPEIAQITYYATIALLPWPASIGYRRFLHGILIKNNLTRRVAYGTIIRLITMTSTALSLYFFTDIDGAIVGATALSSGVVFEAIASKFMALTILKKLKQKNEIDKFDLLTYKKIFSFYYPLALTSLITLGVQPLVIFFIGQSHRPIESLAVLPVVLALVFIFRSLGLSFQEVAIALMGGEKEKYILLRNFAAFIGLFVVTILGVIALSPLSTIWFHNISGLTIELTNFSNLPLVLMILLPGLTVLISFQRAILVESKITKPITYATIIEFIGILIVLIILIKFFGFIGAVAAAVAFVVGRLGANIYLAAYLKVLRN